MQFHRDFFCSVLIWILSAVVISFAQLDFTKDAGNPAMSGGSAGEWNRHVFMPHVIYNPDSMRYEMWFGATKESRPYSIGFAVSADRINWSVVGSNPVMTADAGTWEESNIQSQIVLREDGQYKMWYAGWRGSDPGGIGYATSPDGIHWTKFNDNPILDIGDSAWDAGGPASLCVLPVPGGGYKMWYAAYDAGFDSTAIGYATSADGINWQRDTLNNPVLKPGLKGDWDHDEIRLPRVVSMDSSYYMYYTGLGNNSRAIGVAS